MATTTVVVATFPIYKYIATAHTCYIYIYKDVQKYAYKQPAYRQHVTTSILIEFAFIFVVIVARCHLLHSQKKSTE